MHASIDHRPTHLYILDRRAAAVHWLTVYRNLRAKGESFEQAHDHAHNIVPRFRALTPSHLIRRYLVSAMLTEKLAGEFYRLVMAEEAIKHTFSS